MNKVYKLSQEDSKARTTWNQLFDSLTRTDHLGVTLWETVNQEASFEDWLFDRITCTPQDLTVSMEVFEVEGSG